MFDDTKEVQYLYKTFFVKHTAQEQIRNAEIIARTQDIQNEWSFHLFRKVFYD